MDRRSFLMLKTKGRERVVELSCERLYMRWADARAGVGRPAVAEGAAEGVGSDARSWEGEPPTDIVTETPDQLFEQLERELAQADVLRVLERDWLADEAFRSSVETRVEAFRRRGGTIQ